MKSPARLLLAAALICWVSPHAAESQEEQVTIRVGVDKPGHEIGPRLIGAFFEDINLSGDGGLNAELIKNGSLEIPKTLLGWSTVGEGVNAAQATEAPLSAANPTFLRLTIERRRPDGGVANEGFRGMGLREGEAYRFSFQGRAEAGRSAELLVKLMDESGEAIAEGSIKVEGSAWREHEAELTPSKTAKRGALQIWLKSGRLVDLDSISLCTTDTWQGRRHGLRRDLVQLLADLKPAFFRFPGGCIVEGSQLKYRYQWKTTIGPRDERRLIVNRWNTEFAHRPTPDYYQSFAVGFYEYFLLSEEIGAEPLPIINCGMACQFNTGELVPLDELGPYIQDALDLIEFANGPADSEWGAKRAAMGHPEPFGMKLLGVGNEQWGPEYFERYERFAKVLAERHPEIELISTSGPFPSGERFDYAWPLLRKMDVPIVDEHCYAMPDWFLREAHRYDDYDREGPEVFMGEYAAQSVQIVSPRNRNTLRCALAEAAFLTGVDRNSDIVTMSAYAPLLAHEDGWQWRPNLMWYDNLTSYGTPSYYVQQLFSQHKGDRALPVEVNDARPPAPIAGRFGLGSHNTAVEYRSIAVTKDGETIWAADKQLDAEDFIVHDGEWDVQPGLLAQPRRSGSARVVFGSADWADATLTCQARKTGGREGFSVFFRYGPGGSRIEWNIGGWENTRHGLIGQQATHSTTPNQLVSAEGTVEPDRWYDIRIETSGERVRCFLDDELVHDIEIPVPAIDSVFASAALDTDQSQAIVKVVNPTDDATSVRLTLDGLPKAEVACKLVQLTGNPEDENSIEAPKRVSPAESSVNLAAGDFVHEFPPHSFSILRIPVEATAP
ncbi:Extracellular exo-alpha-L-arabinofuranosidase precursor [Posidoniimonas corsicana]|uniref:non-reducing end alpha-L-arabinofuranosidase n=1 Tax=Posidoniimonas corsicana TaxID=1938618 RepID=A0A5C5VD63_9BACT|nr:alpha-L-arabinofuranosidase C-terminal domain-containing protein [Posidoniimonas corsicana]TWT35933.1 Extracellular exo-alpha-L-arabinofuranosidase precursor [Posidoniimonas corsicana]